MIDDRTERIERTRRLLVEAVTVAGMVMTGDQRIGPEDAASLLRVTPETMRNWRRENKGPPAHRLGIHGSKLSFALHDIAEYIEAGRG